MTCLRALVECFPKNDLPHHLHSQPLCVCWTKAQSNTDFIGGKGGSNTSSTSSATLPSTPISSSNPPAPPPAKSTASSSFRAVRTVPPVVRVETVSWLGVSLSSTRCRRRAALRARGEDILTVQNNDAPHTSFLLAWWCERGVRMGIH